MDHLAFDDEVIRLFYYETYTTKQIATILNMKESTVRSHFNRGRIYLKLLLYDAYDFECQVQRNHE